MGKTIIFALLLVPFFAFGQFADCNSTGPLLEKQITTTLGAGLLRSTGSCVRGAVVNGGLEMVGANVSIIDGDTVGQVLRWTGTDWETRLIIFPAADGGVDTVYNGLTDRDTAFVLGGPLTENTRVQGQKAYDMTFDDMRTIFLEAQRTSGVAFSSVTMGSTAAAGVDFAHYNEADNQKQAVAAVNYSTGNVMKVQDSASNGTYFQQYDNGGGLFQTDITSSNGATSKTIRVNRDAVFVINLEHLDISNEAAFMMIDTFTGELKYKSPADFAGLYGDDWGGQAVSSTARFSGVGTVGSPLELAQQSATSGQVLKWSGSAWTPGTDASGTTYTAENGTYLDGTILKLGTPLTENTAIDGAGFTLGITDASNITLSATGSFGITSTLSVDEFSSSLSILNGSTESLFSGNGTQSYMSHENNSTGATARVMAENYRKVGLQYYPTGGTPTLEYFLDGGATVPGHYQVGMRYKSSGDTMLVTDATTGEVRRRPLSVTPAQITNGTTGSFLRSGASVPAWETAASLQGSLLLPSGTSGQTLRYGSAWTANSLLYNDGTNIGIGTTSPAQKLDVNGEMSVNGVLFGKGPGSGANNVRAGIAAFVSNTTGYNNAAIGTGSLTLNTTGAQNMAIGNAALAQNIDGGDNMAIGTASMYSNVSGSNNVGIGTYSLVSNTVGAFSTGVGHAALQANTIGDYSTAIGGNALYLNTTGDANIGIGLNSGYTITTGSYNIVIGSSSPTDITTGSNNVVIGGNITGLSSSLANNIILADGAGTQRIRVLSDGKVGFSVAAPTESLHLLGTGKFEGLAGTGNRLSLVSSTGVFGESIVSESSGKIGVSKASPLTKFHVNGDIGVYKTGGSNIYIGDANFDDPSYYYQAPGIAAVLASYTGNTANLGLYYASSSAVRTLGALLDYSGRFGIATSSPAQTLHVQGTARLTGSDGTATGLMGRDADGDVSGVGLSVGLEFSGGNIQADLGSGLNVSGNSIAWGGTLTENTTVDFDTYDVFFTNMPASTTEDEALVIDSGTGKLARGQIPITAIRAPGEATYLGDNGATGETVTWQPEDVNVDADPTAGHLTVELNGGMYTGVHYSLFGCCNLTYNIILSGTMKLTGEYGTVSSYTLTAGQHLEVVKFSDNSFRVSKK